MQNSEIVSVNNGQVVTTSIAIADGTGVQHKNVLELVRAYIADLQDFGRVAFETRTFETTGGSQQREIAVLNEQQSTLLLTYMRNSDIVRTFKKALIKEFWRMAEELRKSSVVVPQSLPEALRLAADLAEQKAIAEQERDEAIRTKAMIGSKREATAMATAAAAKREAERLAAELDQSMQYASVKRMEQIYTGRKFNWRELKKASIALGLKAIDVFDQNYITVKAYHAAAWKAVYSLDVMKDSAHA